jgi:feruloyl-CoA synthase
VRQVVAAGLAQHNAQVQGSSRRIARCLLLGEPASIDAGEITDKGYLNQRAVLSARAALVARLYAEPTPPEVILISA